jgi:hypothetical protein
MTLPTDPEPAPAPGEPDGTPSWRDLDDTLADGPSPASVPPGAKHWLAEQRLVHGLLRALHTADAPAREGRIAAILERIDADTAAVPLRRWRWALTAVAAALLAALGVWVALPARLPTAQAAVARVVAELARDVDRRFRLEAVATDAQGQVVMQHEFALVTRPGNRFRIDGKLAFGTFQLGEFRLGCDGEQLWLLPANAMFRRTVPLAERERLLHGLGDVLDLGYLDVHDLVQKLPGDFDLRVVGRERGADGRARLRIEGVRRSAATRARLRSVNLVCDEATGMVTHVDAEADLPRGNARSLRLDYLGEEPPGLVDYRRPW